VSFLDDPIVANILGQIVTDAVRETARRLLQLTSARRGEPADTERSADPLSTLLERMDTACRSPEGDEDAVAYEKVHGLLGSRELGTFVEQLAARQLLHNYTPDSEQALRDTLRGLVDLYPRDEWACPPDELFDRLAGLCEQYLADTHVDDASLYALWQRAVLYEITAIHRSIDNLSRVRAAGLDAEAIGRFEERLRERVRRANSEISLRMLGQNRSYPIERLYVEPRLDLERSFVRPDRRGTVSDPAVIEVVPGRDNIRLHQIRAVHRRAVILGQPGIGKSTLSRKIAFDGTAPTISGRAGAVPFIVVLREVYADTAWRGMSIVQYLAHCCVTRHQMSDATPELIELLLTSGRLDVVFDGLDEVTDPADYQHVVDAIEAFCLEYKAARITVTSRPHGFDWGRFTDFEVFQLQPFEFEQVRSYTANWFAADEAYSPGESAQVTEDFLAQSAGAHDIRRIPLLLALMCAIFAIEGSIPASRSEVYEACASLYFRDWDARRKIRSDARLVALRARDIFGAFSSVAYGIIQDRRLSGTGITRSQLVDLILRYLIEREFLSHQDEEEVASALTEFVTGRAWLLEPTGRNPQGQVLYQFTHRTFLEFFVAEYVVRHHTELADLTAYVLDAAADAKTRVIAELIVQLSGRRRTDFDSMVTALADGSRGAPLPRCIVLGDFLVSLLSLTTMSRRLTSVIVDAVFAVLVRDLQMRQRSGSSRIDNDLGRLLGKLLKADVPSFDVLVDALRTNLVTSLAVAAPETVAIIVSFRLALDEALGGEPIPEDDDRWRRLSTVWLEFLGDGRPPEVAAALRDDLSLALLSWWCGGTAAEDVLAWHGIGACYSTPQSLLIQNPFETVARILIADMVAAWTGQVVLSQADRRALDAVAAFVQTHTMPLTVTIPRRPDPFRYVVLTVPEDDSHDPRITDEHETATVLLIMIGLLLSNTTTFLGDFPPVGGRLGRYKAFVDAWATGAEVDDLATTLTAEIPDQIRDLLLIWASRIRMSDIVLGGRFLLSPPVVPWAGTRPDRGDEGPRALLPRRVRAIPDVHD
jgi:hypothetical protein